MEVYNNLPPRGQQRGDARMTGLREPNEQSSISQQIRQCLAGDASAWKELFVSYYRLIYFLCYSFTKSNSDAEDLTQDVFLKLYCSLSRFDSEKGSFQNWIRNITRNHLVDHYRATHLIRVSESLDASAEEKNARPITYRLMDSRPTPEQSFATLEMKERIYEALDRLTAYSRDAVILCDLEDRNYLEVAQILGIPEGTVKSRLSRGRGELARALAGTELVRRPVSGSAERTDARKARAKALPRFGYNVEYQSSLA
jgi:RNA polymerase sigma-70 factor (ECF subfamily)